MTDDSVTILKYKLEEQYCFHVMDKFAEADEPTRLDKMIEFSASMADMWGDQYQEIWIKTCPIFATR